MKEWEQIPLIGPKVHRCRICGRVMKRAGIGRKCLQKLKAKQQELDYGKVQA